MDDARKQELLKRFPPPWTVAAADGASEIRIERANSDIGLNLIGCGLLEGARDRADLAALLVEAFNQTYGGRGQELMTGFLAFCEIKSMASLPPSVITESGAAAVKTAVSTWRAKASELDAIRAETEQEVSPEIQQAFDDLAREDCNRAARSLGKILGWTATTIKLAGALIFSEMRYRDAADPVPARCNRWHSSFGRCIQPLNHTDEHISASGDAWGIPR